MKDNIFNKAIFAGYLLSGRKDSVINAAIGRDYYVTFLKEKMLLDLFLTKRSNNYMKEYIYKYLKSIVPYSKTKEKSYEHRKNYKKGSRIHLLTQTFLSISETLKSLGFNLAIGPEVEHCIYNFDRLNINYNHVSRKKTDTFYLAGNILLRTHTSSVQSRILSISRYSMPLRVLSYGKVFRRDMDKTHSQMFHQLEGLYVNKNVGFSELKGTLTEFIHRFFDAKVNIRWRSSFFPFTEPSCEIDIECLKCSGRGCDICRRSGWIEVMGAGLIHNSVLDNAGINYQKYNGFAFGLGIERFSMVKYGLHDIKVFTENILQEIYTF
jgi:phenylalanyl-tRNA synthetase alpha chain